MPGHVAACASRSCACRMHAMSLHACHRKQCCNWPSHRAVPLVVSHTPSACLPCQHALLQDCRSVHDGSLHMKQAMVESLLKEYPNILVLRVRMPIVGDLTYTRNFISKIIRYEKVHPCSLSVLLPTLLAKCASLVCLLCPALYVANNCACACSVVHALLAVYRRHDMLQRHAQHSCVGIIEWSMFAVAFLLLCCCLIEAVLTLTCYMMQIVNIPNSMTVLPELLPYSIEMVGAFWRLLCAALPARVCFPSSAFCRP